MTYESPSLTFSCHDFPGPASIFNRHRRRCKWAETLGYCWEFKEYFKDKVRKDKFLHGFKRCDSEFKPDETHEFRIFRTAIGGEKLATVFKWRTKRDLEQMARGELVPGFWRCAEDVWPEGTPPFKPNADFSKPPALGGFKEDWHGCDLSKGERPFAAAVNFVRENPQFSNCAAWMQELNPEWQLEGNTNCVEELRKEVDKAPLDEETFLRQREKITFQLPLRWDVVTESPRAPCTRRYRGYEAEHPQNVEEVSPMDQGITDRVNLMEHPARGEHPGRDSKAISKDERTARRATASQKIAEAELRSDEPVEVGSLVFVRGADRSEWFPQPLQLALVTQIEFHDDADTEKGSSNHEDQLTLQFLANKSGYDKMYVPAVMADVDADVVGKPRNNVWTETMPRSCVAVARVVTNLNATTQGNNAQPKPLEPFPSVMKRVTNKHKHKVRKISLLALEDHPLAMYAEHSGTEKARKEARRARLATRSKGDGGGSRKKRRSDKQEEEEDESEDESSEDDGLVVSKVADRMWVTGEQKKRRRPQ